MKTIDKQAIEELIKLLEECKLSDCFAGEPSGFSDNVRREFVAIMKASESRQLKKKKR